MSERAGSPFGSLEQLMKDRTAIRKEITNVHERLDAAITRDDITDENRAYLIDVRAQLEGHTETFLAQASSVEWRKTFRGYVMTVQDEIERVLRESKQDRR